MVGGMRWRWEVSLGARLHGPAGTPATWQQLPPSLTPTADLDRHRDI